MAEAQSDSKMLEALKLLETDEKEIGLRKASILAFLNTRKEVGSLEKQKASLQGEIEALKKTYEVSKEQQAKDWNERVAEMKQKADDWEKAHQAQKDDDQKELAGLKTSIAKAKKQAAEAEKDFENKNIERAERTNQIVVDGQKLIDALQAQIQEKRDKIARLDEEFRSIAARHGLGAAIGG